MYLESIFLWFYRSRGRDKKKENYENDFLLFRIRRDSRTGSVSGAEPTSVDAFDAVNAKAEEEAELARAKALAEATGGGSRKDKDHNLKQIMQERFDLYKVSRQCFWSDSERAGQQIQN